MIGAGLQRFDRSADGQPLQAFSWQGTLITSTVAVRQVTGHLIGTLPSHDSNPGQVQVSLTNTATGDAWMGLSGSHVTPNWAEDVHFDPGEAVYDPATLLFSTLVFIQGDLSHYDLQLWPTYLFNG